MTGFIHRTKNKIRPTIDTEKIQDNSSELKKTSVGGEIENTEHWAASGCTVGGGGESLSNGELSFKAANLHVYQGPWYFPSDSVIPPTKGLNVFSCSLTFGTATCLTLVKEAMACVWHVVQLEGHLHNFTCYHVPLQVHKGTALGGSPVLGGRKACEAEPCTQADATGAFPQPSSKTTRIMMDVFLSQVLGRFTP